VFIKNAWGEKFTMHLSELQTQGALPLGECENGYGWVNIQNSVSAKVDNKSVYRSETDIQLWHADKTADCHSFEGLAYLLIPLRNQDVFRYKADLTVFYSYEIHATLKTSDGEFQGTVTEVW
jgi:hypothetical protein